MTIEILPARLANQIAAGEVVERPASVIKELIENSLDAGANHIQIDIDKGGVKKIRITDNGSGIAKDELKLALSRHATSKIKDLGDLEAINSLGFRGEALASISSVARLTLTSKPAEQATAWQACAQGRDMEVIIQPAAHPNGTTIEVLDLFFNTPARRKFLRTEKTEFNHIDEVVRRIALANFETTFVLSHNGKMVRQYRAARDKSQYHKRVAMVCGQKFMENAIEVDCPHDNMTLTGWLANPSFYRGQNDLSYSYVNGRMMRDKLINHAIRQAYADLLPADTYPAFVLFLTLDHKEVDVNVHPAKHEVRFHQSRYVHDFIYSVCSKALLSGGIAFDDIEANDKPHTSEQSAHAAQVNNANFEHSLSGRQSVAYSKGDYPRLQQVSDARGSVNYQHSSTGVSKAAVESYQQLMTPLSTIQNPVSEQSPPLWREKVNSAQIGAVPFEQSQAGSIKVEQNTDNILVHIEKSNIGVIKLDNQLRVLSFTKLSQALNVIKVEQSWQAGMVSQPLLLPIVLTLSEQQAQCVQQQEKLLAQAGIIITMQAKHRVQIRQFPALLRDKDVSESFSRLIDELLTALCEVTAETNSRLEDKLSSETDDAFEEKDCSIVIKAIAKIITLTDYSEEQAIEIFHLAKKLPTEQFISLLHLNSVPLDLTSEANQLK